MNVSKSVVTSLEKFMQDYKLACPAAFQRLQIGVPATVEVNKQERAKQRKIIYIFLILNI